MRIIFLVFLFILGACLGSFLCCQARRLHLRTANTAKSAKSTHLGKRSVCLHCGYQLKWYDNLPIFSWLALKGKCRKCGKKIGFAELLSELGVGFVFLALGAGFVFNLSATTTLAIAAPFGWPVFITILVFAAVLAFLAIYDGLYGQLPTVFLTISIICAIIVLILKDWSSLSVSNFSPNLLYDPLLAFLILGGLYFGLYKISHGKWVGDGDWLLGTALALALGTPWLALLTLFVANLLACLVMLPTLKHNKSRRIHFGPFMVVAFVLVYSFCGIINL